jgi:hypothetical protein
MCRVHTTVADLVVSGTAAAVPDEVVRTHDM